MRNFCRQTGVTLLELLVAMLLLVLVTGMLYSVLNAGIGFSKKGEDRLFQVERERALLDLLHRQVQGAWYDQRLKTVRIAVEGDYLQLVTTEPMINRDAGVALIEYFYDQNRKTLYYQEKKDFYNSDYEEGYSPDPRDMLELVHGLGGLTWEYDQENGLLKIGLDGRTYELSARCWRPGGRS